MKESIEINAAIFPKIMTMVLGKPIERLGRKAQETKVYTMSVSCNCRAIFGLFLLLWLFYL